jgi:hypothetical protein
VLTVGIDVPDEHDLVVCSPSDTVPLLDGRDGRPVFVIVLIRRVENEGFPRGRVPDNRLAGRPHDDDMSPIR